MAIKYNKLFALLEIKGLKRTDLIVLAGISAPTLAKLGKSQNITTEIIDKICNSLDSQPCDIMEFEKD